MERTKQILKRVKKLEIKTKHLVDGLLQGAYHSIFKGRGIEFSEVREYQIGDDVRTIDWNVTARMNRPYVKEFIEERDLTIYLVFDVSSSSEFGNTKEKREAAIEIAASLMFAALRNNDKAGLCLFTEKVEKFIPARKGKKHVLKLIREMIYYTPQNKGTNIAKSIAYLSKILKKKSIIFIISDFYSPNYYKEMQLLKSRHEIICLKISDEREMEIPDIGYIELEDEETGEQVLVNTSDPNFRKKYVSLVLQRNQEMKKKLSKMKVDLLMLNTSKPFENEIRKYFSIRRKRR